MSDATHYQLDFYGEEDKIFNTSDENCWGILDGDFNSAASIVRCVKELYRDYYIGDQKAA